MMQNEVSTRCGLALAFVLAVLVYVFVLEGDQRRGMNVLGLMCNAVTIAFFAAPLATMVSTAMLQCAASVRDSHVVSLLQNEVLTTQSTETMSLPLSSMSAVTTFLWVAYGALQWDFYVIVSRVHVLALDARGDWVCSV